MLGHLRRGVFQEDMPPVRWEWDKLCFRLGTPPSVDFTVAFEEKETLISWDLRHQPVDGLLVIKGINTQSLEVVVRKYEALKGEGKVPMYADELADKHAYYAVFKKDRNRKPKISEAVFLGMRERVL